MASGNGYPWDLARVPNQRTASAPDTIDVADLDVRTFWTRFVRRNRPCLVKRAAARWPACSRWCNDAYITTTIGDVRVRASCEPKVEAFGLRTAARDAEASRLTRDRLLLPQPVRDLLPRLRTPDDEVLFLELRPANPGVERLAHDLADDGARFPFLPAPPKPRFLYSGWAVMFYKNSYSDWHFHPGTDAMMVQVMGTKDVLLLPPTARAWQQIVPVHQEQWKVYDVDIARAPAYLDIRPFHAVVEPGDGLFIPVNWWHAVQGRPGEYGITVPVTWDTPYRDLRQPATRHFLRVLWRSRKKQAMTELLASAYGAVGAALTPAAAGVRPAVASTSASRRQTK